MQTTLIPLALLLAASEFAACARTHSAPSAPVAPQVSSRTVFNDSTLHDKLCVATRPGEDWRSVCTPRDQSEAPRLKPTLKP